jgi:hypothetical protein
LAYLSVGHHLERAHRIVSFPSRYLLYIRPELSPRGLKILEHFVPERFRPVIEQCKSKVEQILFIMSFHHLFLLKGAKTKMRTNPNAIYETCVQRNGNTISLNKFSSSPRIFPLADLVRALRIAISRSNSVVLEYCCQPSP